MKFNTHKLKKHFKSQFAINAIIKYIPSSEDMELIEYFPDTYLPKSVIEAELPYMTIPFGINKEGYYVVYISGDESTGDVQIDSYKFLEQNDLEEFTK